jgi:hypothetical protein
MQLDQYHELRQAKRDTADVYEFHFTPFGWAYFYIHEYPGGGILTIVSDWGNYGYAWGSIGPGTFRQFIMACDPEYIITKFSYDHGQDFCRQFNGEKTAQSLRQDILKRRRGGELGAQEARDLWDTFEHWCPGNDQEWYWDKPPQLHQYWPEINEWFCYEPSPTCRYLVDHLIPFFQCYLKEELGSKPERKPDLSLAAG